MKAADSSAKQTAKHLFVCLKLKNPKWCVADGKELCRDNDLTRSRGSSARATGIKERILYLVDRFQHSDSRLIYRISFPSVRTNVLGYAA